MFRKLAVMRKRDYADRGAKERGRALAIQGQSRDTWLGKNSMQSQSIEMGDLSVQWEGVERSTGSSDLTPRSRAVQRAWHGPLQPRKLSPL